MTHHTSKIVLLCLSTAVLLSACSTSSHTSYKDHTRPVEYELTVLEKAYEKNPENELAAIGYARALRETDNENRALDILKPFISSDNPSSNVLAEYAAGQLDIKEYRTAENYAQKAIKEDNNNVDAYRYLGMALEGQNFHEQAEEAFRTALKKSNDTSVDTMNNLALNLASQGIPDEAAQLLSKAKSLAPERIDIERNLRIVRALQQSHGYQAPKPSNKPKQKAE